MISYGATPQLECVPYGLSLGFLHSDSLNLKATPNTLLAVLVDERKFLFKMLLLPYLGTFVKCGGFRNEHCKKLAANIFQQIHRSSQTSISHL